MVKNDTKLPSNKIVQSAPQLTNLTQSTHVLVETVRNTGPVSKSAELLLPPSRSYRTRVPAHRHRTTWSRVWSCDRKQLFLAETSLVNAGGAERKGVLRCFGWGRGLKASRAVTRLMASPARV